MARANAVRHPRVFQRFSLTEIAGLALTEAPRTNDLHRWCNAAIGVPSEACWLRSRTIFSLMVTARPEVGPSQRFSPYTPRRGLLPGAGYAETILVPRETSQ